MYAGLGGGDHRSAGAVAFFRDVVRDEEAACCLHRLHKLVMRGAGGFDKEEYLVLVLAESFFKSDVKNDLHITLTFEGEKGYIE